MEENKSFTFNFAKVKFVSSKMQYGSMVYYFVVDHEKTKIELDKIIDSNKDVKLPMFVSDTSDIIINVKVKIYKEF